MQQSFSVLMKVTTESDTPMTEAKMRRMVENLRKVVEEIVEVKVYDCDEKKDRRNSQSN